MLAKRASPSPENKNGHERGESSREDTTIEDSQATSGVGNVDALHQHEGIEGSTANRAHDVGVNDDKL